MNYIKKLKTPLLCIIIICQIALISVLINNNIQNHNELDVLQNIIKKQSETTLLLESERTNLKKEKSILESQIIALKQEQERLEETLLKLQKENEEEEKNELVDNNNNNSNGVEVSWSTPFSLGENDKALFTKLLYCESGNTSYDCLLYTGSAILNLWNTMDCTFAEMAYNKNFFSVADILNTTTPQGEVYNVVEDILNGKIVKDIKYFRTDYYHSFGTPVTNIDNVYFSK